MKEDLLDKTVRQFEEFFTTVTSKELPFYVSHGDNMKLLGREIFRSLLTMTYNEDMLKQFISKAKEIVQSNSDWTLHEFGIKYLHVGLPYCKE